MITEIMEDELYFAKTKLNAIIPTKREEDAGYDIYTCETETIVIEPCSTRMIDSGIAIACNKAWFPKFFDKGGMGSKGIIVGAGVGDSGYRNGYFIPLINTNRDKWLIITNQNEKSIEESKTFDLYNKRFTDIVDISNTPMVTNMLENGDCYINKQNCIIKPLNKAITQFVMLPVPKLKTKEISWEELQNISSDRGLGNLGSSGK